MKEENRENTKKLGRREERTRYETTEQQKKGTKEKRREKGKQEGIRRAILEKRENR